MSHSVTQSNELTTKRVLQHRSICANFVSLEMVGCMIAARNTVSRGAPRALNSFYPAALAPATSRHLCQGSHCLVIRSIVGTCQRPDSTRSVAATPDRLVDNSAEVAATVQQSVVFCSIHKRCEFLLRPSLASAGHHSTRRENGPTRSAARPLFQMRTFLRF